MSEQKQKCGCSHYILKWYEQLSVIILVFIIFGTSFYGFHALSTDTPLSTTGRCLSFSAISYVALMYYLLVHLRTKDVCLGHEEEEYW